MPDPQDERDKQRKRNPASFTQSEMRDRLVKEEIEKERAATDAKTARLRALRLAKEEQDRIEAERLAAEKREQNASKPARAPKRKTATKA